MQTHPALETEACAHSQPPRALRRLEHHVKVLLLPDVRHVHQPISSLLLQALLQSRQIRAGVVEPAVRFPADEGRLVALHLACGGVRGEDAHRPVALLRHLRRHRSYQRWALLEQSGGGRRRPCATALMCC